MKNILIVFLMVALTACGGDDNSSNIVSVTGVSLDTTVFGLKIGGSRKLTATVQPANATNPRVTWSSSAESIATVDATGTVAGAKAGQAIITAQTLDGGFTASATVTVSPDTIPVSGVKVAPPSQTVTAGSSTPFTATVSPPNATNPNVEWSTDDSTIATVNASGVATGKQPGTAHIIATSVDGGHSDRATLTVKPAPTFTIGGTLSGLTSGSLVLSSNGSADHLTLTNNGPFTFTNKVSDYTVLVEQQPQGFQTCTVRNGSGTATKDVTDIVVDCKPANAVVTTPYGSGSAGNEDGQGRKASFDNPWGITTDDAGNLYVSDLHNHSIRKITPDGYVSTWVDLDDHSNSQDGPQGITVDHTTGNVYVTVVAGDLHKILKIAPDTTVSTIKSSDRTISPLAVDQNGNVYTADAYAIYKITPDGTMLPYAGTGAMGSHDGPADQATFNLIQDIAIDQAGSLYVTQGGYVERTPTIRKVADGQVSTYAGSGKTGSDDGPADRASFGDPYGVAVDAAGNVYVTDRKFDKIRMITPDRYVSTLAGTGQQGTDDGPAHEASFDSPAKLVADKAGYLYVIEEKQNKIRQIETVLPSTTGHR